MNIEFFTLVLLIVILCLLILLLMKFNNKNINKENYEIEKISQNIESLLNKTLEQSGYVNSKIDEIGDLTKKNDKCNDFKYFGYGSNGRSHIRKHTTRLWNDKR